MSASAQPAANVPARRAVIIGLVAVLAIAIGIAAGSFLLTNRVAAIGAGAAYVPADAPFYFEMRLEPSAAQDGALRELLGRFPSIEGVDLDQPLYAQMTERLDEMLAAEGAGVSWADDVAPWFDGRLAVGVIEIPLAAMEVPADPMAVPDVPPVVVLLGVTDAAEAAEAIGRLLAAGGGATPTFTDSEHAGFTIHTAEGTGGGSYALTDDQVVIGSDADSVRSALDAHDAGSGTLAEVAEMTRLTDTLPTDWLAFMTYDMTDLMAESLSAEQDPAVSAALESLMENQPLRGALAFSAGGDRFVLDAATDPPTGPFAVENADRGLASEVPSDVLLYTDAGNIGTALASVVDAVREAAATTPEVAEQLDMVEAALGADLSEVVSWIDDGAFVVGYDGSEPYAGMVLVPNDVDAAERRLGQLATFATAGTLDPTSGLSVEEADVDGVTVTTIRWDDPNVAGEGPMGSPTSVVVEYAVTDDRALIGLGDGFVARVLALDEGDSLASEPRFVDAVAELGGADNAGVAWLDLTGTREAVEGALGPMMTMMDPEGLYASEVQPWLLPLDRLVSVSRLEGDVLVQRGALIVE